MFVIIVNRNLWCRLSYRYKRLERVVRILYHIFCLVSCKGYVSIIVVVVIDVVGKIKPILASPAKEQLTMAIATFPGYHSLGKLLQLGS